MVLNPVLIFYLVIFQIWGVMTKLLLIFVQKYLSMKYSIWYTEFKICIFGGLKRPYDYLQRSKIGPIWFPRPNFRWYRFYPGSKCKPLSYNGPCTYGSRPIMGSYPYFPEWETGLTPPALGPHYRSDACAWRSRNKAVDMLFEYILEVQYV
jgi:hypothetical protein